MRWLLLKDLRILRRSPLLVALLVIYPIAIALLMGFALSGGPGKPTIAIYNEIPPTARSFDVAGSRLNADEYLPDLLRSVNVVRAHSRAQARQLVRDGKVLGAVILPADITQKLATGREQPAIEVLYNGEDAVKQRYVESVIRARMAEANVALSRRFQQATVGYLQLLLDGGTLNLLGRDVNILGLKNAHTIVAGSIDALPAGSPLRTSLGQVATFGRLAIDNLGVSKDVLRSVGQPVTVRQTIVGGKRTPLDTFAAAISITVSLMFLTLLLASGLLALEREEHAFSRLVRGLVSRLGLLVEKIGLAALCAFAVTLLMLVALGGFFIELDWARLPQWLLALAAGAVAFAALGVAIGGLAREVRAASLLAFLLSLPIAFLALVPSGAVSSGLYDVVRAVSAAFPFRATLQALDAALNNAQPGILGPLAHLAALTVAYTLLARLALRRFA
ncbi:MAG TPA: ABC transporter permease [Conexibacter sp.]|jgi:ABC-type transport system involved in cytochrome c biogenesis permease component|nr:ABC transporter permease [Conexibacter sp.]